MRCDENEQSKATFHGTDKYSTLESKTLKFKRVPCATHVTRLN